MPFDPRGFPGYLFDLDGTLIDTAPDICAAVNHALNRFGYAPVPESMVRHWVGHGGKVCIEQAVASAQANRRGASAAKMDSVAAPEPVQRPQFRGEGTSAAKMDGVAADAEALGPGTGRQPSDAATVDDMLDCFIDHYRAHIADASRPYPQVVDALRSLSARGAKLAVVTNKRIELTLKLLAQLHLTSYFDAIVGGDSTANPKPAADPILFACKEIGLTPADILFVGDSRTDVDSARAAGCPVVCVPDGYNHGIAPTELGAAAIIESLADLV